MTGHLYGKLRDLVSAMEATDAALKDQVGQDEFVERLDDLAEKAKTLADTLRNKKKAK